jgi:hypothetical protein
MVEYGLETSIQEPRVDSCTGRILHDQSQTIHAPWAHTTLRLTDAHVLT